MRKAAAGPGRFLLFRKVEHPGSRRCQSRRLATDKAQPLHHRFRIERCRRPDRHAGHETRRRQRVGRDPVDEIAHLLGKRRAIEGERDRPQLLRVERAVVRAIPHDADHLARTDRHLHDRTGHNSQSLRHGIAIRTRHRQRHQDRHDGRDGLIEERTEQVGRICVHGGTMPKTGTKGNRCLALPAVDDTHRGVKFRLYHK